MPIDWNSFQKNLKNYFGNYLGKSEDHASSFITTLYVTNILTGNDLSYKNKALQFNKNMLETALKNTFKVAKIGGTTDHFSQMISQGLIGFWTGAELSKLIPPLGSITIITKFVNNPGTPQSLRVFNTRDADIFARNLIIMFKMHLTTISGITTALVPTPAGPVPTPFPWQGYS